MLPESITRLIALARRRLMTMDLLRRLAAAVGVVAAAGALLLGIARQVVITWAEPAVVVAGIVVVLGVVAFTLARPPTATVAALEIDQRLDGKDQVSTALELVRRDPPSDMERRQISRSASWAESRSMEGFGSVAPSRRLVVLGVVALVAAFALAVPASSADAKQAEREEIADTLDAIASQLETEAEQLHDKEVADALRETAEKLRDAEDLDDAVERLGDARQDLAEQRDAEALALKTALSGLDERLRQNPIGEGDDAASQLQDLRDSASGLTEAERAARAAALADLAEQLGAAAPDLAGALQDVADALEGGGDPAQAIDGALGELGDAAARVGRAGDLANAGAAVRDAQNAAAGARDARGGGDGDGSGDGSGSGTGSGTGTGTGTGSGTGSGGGGGGSGTGADNPDPVDGGIGGPNQLQPGQGDNDIVRDPVRSNVLDPVGFERGDEHRIDFDTLDPTGSVRGRAQGEGVENLPLVPYTDRFAEYQRQALGALDRMAIAGSLQDIVRDYFTELGT